MFLNYLQISELSIRPLYRHGRQSILVLDDAFFDDGLCLLWADCDE